MAAVVIVGILIALACIVFLVAVSRHHDSVTEDDWCAALSPDARRLFGSLRDRLSGERRAVAGIYDRGAKVLDRGDTTHAMRLLDAGYEYLADLIPERLRLVRALTTYSRMVSAMGPAPEGALRLLALRHVVRAAMRSFFAVPRDRMSWERLRAARSDFDQFSEELDGLVRAIAAASVPADGGRA